jgi:hypothetical protein
LLIVEAFILRNFACMIAESLSQKTTLRATLGTLAILAGGFIYVVFRSEHLIMFSWFDKLGLSPSVEYLRNAYGEHTIYAWAKYNLPAALWLFSYLFIMDSIWSNRQNKTLYLTFMSIVPIMAFSSEILQYFSLISGTFDYKDLLSYFCAIIFFLIINKLIK